MECVALKHHHRPRPGADNDCMSMSLVGISWRRACRTGHPTERIELPQDPRRGNRWLLHCSSGICQLHPSAAKIDRPRERIAWMGRMPSKATFSKNSVSRSRRPVNG